jgi:hypothetical protein
MKGPGKWPVFILNTELQGRPCLQHVRQSQAIDTGAHPPQFSQLTNERIEFYDSVLNLAVAGFAI